MDLQAVIPSGRAAANPKRRSIGTPLALSAAALLALAAFDASAATFRYSASSNRIYIENGGNATLTDIKAAVPEAPLDLIDVANKIWLLRANLVISDGSVLQLHGGDAGDVKWLRIQSNESSAANSFVSITADYGGIDMNATKVTSWNTDTSSVDTDYATFGRAFIRVRSSLALDGITPLESRMDIVNSEVAYLGYDASESYGLVWKVTGSDPQITSKVDVHGDIIGSHLHHLFQGTYTFGHKDGQWMDNEIDHNASYGIYAHDDSDGMVIDGNNVHDNGADGIYLVMKSDHAAIRNNKSWNNTGHGLRLRQGANAATVENNQIYNNTDSGIALFQASKATITGNVVHDNGTYGIRLTQASNDNLIQDNEVMRNARQGVYLYRDDAWIPPSGTDGRPSGNQLNRNFIHDNTLDGLKSNSAIKLTVSRNRFASNGTTQLVMFGAAHSQFINNSVPAGVTVKVQGTSTEASQVHFALKKPLTLQIDAFSTTKFSDQTQHVYDVNQNVAADCLPKRCVLALTTATLGTTLTTVSPRNLVAKPATNSAVSVNPIVWAIDGDFRKTWSAQSADGSVSVHYTVGDLVPSTAYTVTQNSTTVGTFTANGSGVIAFDVTPGSTAAVTYSVLPSP